MDVFFSNIGENYKLNKVKSKPIKQSVYNPQVSSSEDSKNYQLINLSFPIENNEPLDTVQDFTNYKFANPSSKTLLLKDDDFTNYHYVNPSSKTLLFKDDDFTNYYYVNPSSKTLPFDNEEALKNYQFVNPYPSKSKSSDIVTNFENYKNKDSFKNDENSLELLDPRCHGLNNGTKLMVGICRRNYIQCQNVSI